MKTLPYFSITMELGLCQKREFSIPIIFATLWCKPLIFQTISGCKNIGIGKFKFVAKTEFLSKGAVD